ncbi:diguanylate cyclase domain-containing protein [Actinokineospora bangkokensis]|uniref:GGDEF domain-containing protein n=1 Tax=Actinokineospora bangkokensis TaxID=1193682 RepID=A0A1Q9LE95_9PSEU|nr:diguanylate cyclase [Actinokineospora bangkokensis]OLR90367.1 hypothetical protein BJP25_27290 [Actinokineospora bangkokensis]
MGAPDDLVEAWLRVVAATAYVPRSSRDVRALLAEMLAELEAALRAEPFGTGPGAAVGARMVTGALTGEDTLARSAAVLGDGLLAAGHDPRRVVALLAAVSTGYAAALRARTLEQQEDMKLALLSAARLAERGRRDSEHRFREVFAASPTGIALTGPDGRCVEVNPALSQILDRPAEQLRGSALGELLTDPDAGAGAPPVRTGPDRRRVVRPDGDEVWVLVRSSRLTGEDGGDGGGLRVVTVQDLSEVELLGTRLSHQSLHDALTGLLNRVAFRSRLEARLEQVGPGAPVTLFVLDLDAFGLVNTAHGHEAGDRVLRTVAARLTALLDDEDALLARVGGDEFAVLVVDGPGTPDVPGLVAAVRGALAEPEYDGPLGLAVSASIGVVRCRAGELGPEEVFRAADAALARARAAGRDQWAVHDPHADRSARRVGAAAVALPAAWENGDLVVAYRPVVGLAGMAPVRVSALAHQPRALAGLPPTAELAERTGFAVALAPLLLAEAAQRLPVWRALFPGGGPALRVALTRTQSADADLVRAVRAAVEVAGVPPGLLEVVLDASAVAGAVGDARDNLRTLADMGVVRGLHGFRGGPAEVALVERFGVGPVLLADPFDDWRPDWLPGHAPAVLATDRLVAALTSVGAEVGVVGVRDRAEARWWAEHGAVTAEGPAFGGPLDVEDVLASVRRWDSPPSERIAPT